MKMCLYYLSLCFSLIGCTTVTWDGGFPSQTFIFHIVDQQFKPIPGVSLTIIESKTKTPSPGYPINEFKGQPLKSDEAGKLLASHESNGLEFGGNYSYFIFPFLSFSRSSMHGPQYTLIFTADGYKRTEISYDDLVDSCKVIDQKLICVPDKTITLVKTTM